MRKIFILCLVLLSGCAGPSRATSMPTPQVFNVALTPSVSNLAGELHTCADSSPNLVININEIPAPSLDINTASLSIRLGGKPTKGYTAPINNETIVLIINENNPVLTISPEEISGIFTGQITNWNEIGGEQQTIQVWSYLNGDDTREIFDESVFPGEQLTPNALLAPDPQAMLEAVGDDPLAIGYIPQSWISPLDPARQIRIVEVNEKLAEKLHQPVLAFSRSEPQGPLRKLLFCLQSGGK